jgi:hypothetical protein
VNSSQGLNFGEGSGVVKVMATGSVDIRVRYTTIDRFSQSRRFKTLEGAQKYAAKYVGETPELGSFYAVSGDGVGKITCEGCRVSDLFPKLGGSGRLTLPKSKSCCDAREIVWGFCANCGAAAEVIEV